MTIIRKFGITLAATAAGFGLLGISAPALATTASATSSVTSATHTGVTAYDITWGGGKTFSLD